SVYSNNFPAFCFSSRRRHTRLVSDWSSDVCSSDLARIFFDFGALVLVAAIFDGEGVKAEFARQFVEIPAGRIRNVNPEDVGRVGAMIGDEVGITDGGEFFRRPVEYESVDHCVIGGWWLVVGGWWLVFNVPVSSTNHQPPTTNHRPLIR